MSESTPDREPIRPAGFRPPLVAPAEILAATLDRRPVLQDARPLAESLEWELGQRCYALQGHGAFISESAYIPYEVNNDGRLACAAVRILFDQLRALEADRKLPDRVIALEFGVGTGLFARYVLNEFRELCRASGTDYYQRLCYVAVDSSERMLDDIRRHGILSEHDGHYTLVRGDALQPLAAVPRGSAGGLPQPVQAVFLNYLLDCLPLAILHFADGRLSQVYATTRLPAGIDPEEHTGLSVTDIRRLAAGPGPADELLELYDLLAVEYETRPVDPGTLPFGRLAVEMLGHGPSRLVHSYGALQALENVLDLLGPRGFVLISDYGVKGVYDEAESVEHQSFARATAMGVNFALLRRHLEGWRDCLWIEPKQDPDTLSCRLLGSGITDDNVAWFREFASKDSYDTSQASWRQARQHAQKGRTQKAATLYAQALRQQPKNWALLGEVALFQTFALGDPEGGLQMAEAALAINPILPQAWNVLGDSSLELGRHAEAQVAYTRALEVDPREVGARYRLARLAVRRRDHRGALRLIGEALALDDGKLYRDLLLELQSMCLSTVDRLLGQRSRRAGDRIGWPSR